MNWVAPRADEPRISTEFSNDQTVHRYNFVKPRHGGVGGRAAADKVDYNRDIKPILSDNCYACHGPDAGTVKAGLRLDLLKPLQRN